MALLLALGGRLKFAGVSTVVGEEFDITFCLGSGRGVFLGLIRRALMRITKQKPETIQKSEVFPEAEMGLRKLAIFPEPQPISRIAVPGLSFTVFVQSNDQEKICTNSRRHPFDIWQNQPYERICEKTGWLNH